MQHCSVLKDFRVGKMPDDEGEAKWVEVGFFFHEGEVKSWRSTSRPRWTSSGRSSFGWWDLDGFFELFFDLRLIFKDKQDEQQLNSIRCLDQFLTVSRSVPDIVIHVSGLVARRICPRSS